jgi:hypothetical protein
LLVVRCQWSAVIKHSIYELDTHRVHFGLVDEH